MVNKGTDILFVFQYGTHTIIRFTIEIGIAVSSVNGKGFAKEQNPLLATEMF